MEKQNITSSQLIVIRAESTNVSTGASGPSGSGVEQRVDTNNDGKVDYVVRNDPRTIAFSREFLKARPQFCSLLARTYRTPSATGLRSGDQRQFEAAREFALGTFGEFRDALKSGSVRQGSGLLSFHGKDGVQRTVQDFTTKDGRLASLTISGPDGKQVRIEDTALLSGIEKILSAGRGPTLIARRASH
jgi:hypothetical protein